MPRDYRLVVGGHRQAGTTEMHASLPFLSFPFLSPQPFFTHTHTDSSLTYLYFLLSFLFILFCFVPFPPPSLHGTRTAPHRMQLMHDVGLYGRIATMQLYRPQNEQKDLLFISTERYQFCVLAYDETEGELVTRAQGDVRDRIGRPTDNGQVTN